MLETYTPQTLDQAEDFTAWMINHKQARQEAREIEEIELELQVSFVVEE
jgi:hypothetical protein